MWREIRQSLQFTDTEISEFNINEQHNNHGWININYTAPDDQSAVHTDKEFTLSQEAVNAPRKIVIGFDPTSNSWSGTALSTDRSFDSNAFTMQEMADVLATLINDLNSHGVLG